MEYSPKKMNELLEKNDLDDENFVLLQSFSSESLIRARQLAPNLSLIVPKL